MVTIEKPATNLSSFSYVFLFGGDTYDGDDTRRNHMPGLLDLSWESGYKNDGRYWFLHLMSNFSLTPLAPYLIVWRTAGTEWFVKGDVRLKTEYKQKIPRVYSKLEWSEVQTGIRPPLGMTHDDWISCEKFFRNVSIY